MGARYRICETCVYCSFAGNCDRYDKPLTSIEQPACDAYEIHPLLDKNDKLKAENAKLRELCKDMMAFVEDDDACERCGHDVECVEAADGELVLPYEGQCLMLDLFAVEVDS